MLKYIVKHPRLEGDPIFDTLEDALDAIKALGKEFEDCEIVTIQVSGAV